MKARVTYPRQLEWWFRLRSTTGYRKIKATLNYQLCTKQMAQHLLVLQKQYEGTGYKSAPAVRHRLHSI